MLSSVIPYPYSTRNLESGACLLDTCPYRATGGRDHGEVYFSPLLGLALSDKAGYGLGKKACYCTGGESQVGADPRITSVDNQTWGLKF